MSQNNKGRFLLILNSRFSLVAMNLDIISDIRSDKTIICIHRCTGTSQIIIFIHTEKPNSQNQNSDLFDH